MAAEQDQQHAQQAGNSQTKQNQKRSQKAHWRHRQQLQLRIHRHQWQQRGKTSNMLSKQATYYAQTRLAKRFIWHLPSLLPSFLHSFLLLLPSYCTSRSAVLYQAFGLPQDATSLRFWDGISCQVSAKKIQENVQTPIPSLSLATVRISQLTAHNPSSSLSPIVIHHQGVNDSSCISRRRLILRARQPTADRPSFEPGTCESGRCYFGSMGQQRTMPIIEFNQKRAAVPLHVAVRPFSQVRRNNGCLCVSNPV